MSDGVSVVHTLAKLRGRLARKQEGTRRTIPPAPPGPPARLSVPPAAPEKASGARPSLPPPAPAPGGMDRRQRLGLTMLWTLAALFGLLAFGDNVRRLMAERTAPAEPVLMEPEPEENRGP